MTTHYQKHMNSTRKGRMILIILGLLGVFTNSFTDGASLIGPWRRTRAKRDIQPYPTPSALIPDFDFMLSHSLPMLCPSSSLGVAPRKKTLSDKQMMELLHETGGTFNPNLMATSRTAANQFPNMLSITQPFKDDEMDEADSFDFDPVRDNEITKTQLLLDLHRWSSLKTQLAVNSTISRNNRTSNTIRPRSSPETTRVAHTTGTSSVRPSPEESVPQGHLQPSAIMDHDLKRTLEQLNEQIEGLLQGKSFRSANIMDMVNRFNISTNPRVLQGLDLGSSFGQRRVARSADGSTTAIQYCRQKGNATADGFLHMCTECAATTTLTNDKFPHYLNEVVCGGSDRTCLTVNGTPHGVCKQSYIYLNLLRRRPGGCRMMIQNGQQVLVDAWEQYTQKIRSGCECFINKQSLFAKYIGGPIG